MAASSAAPETETTRVSEAQIVLAIALLAMAFLFIGIGRYGVVNADEAIYHGIAERMAETGDFLHLDFRGEPRVYDAFMNAPLHYWARAALISLFDSSRVTMQRCRSRRQLTYRNHQEPVPSRSRPLTRKN